MRLSSRQDRVSARDAPLGVADTFMTTERTPSFPPPKKILDTSIPLLFFCMIGFKDDWTPPGLLHLVLFGKGPCTPHDSGRFAACWL